MKKFVTMFIIGITMALLPIVIFVVIIGGSMSSASDSLADDYMKASDAIGCSWQEMMAFDLVRYENNFDNVNPYATAMEFAILYITIGESRDSAVEIKQTPNDILDSLGLSEHDDLEHVIDATNNNPLYSLSCKSIEDVMDTSGFTDEQKAYMGELLIGGLLSEQYADTLPGHIDAYGYFAWPTPSYLPDSITSSYGYRIHPITGIKAFHYGLDIACSVGSPVVAIADGMVQSVGYTASTGYYVILNIDDEENHYSWRIKYFHLSEITCKAGQSIDKGDVIASSGNSGNSTGPHLHIETICNGVYQDPLPLLKGE